MEKSADAFRTISEVSGDLDLPQHVLRFWETRFPQVRPLKRAGGRRYYRPADVALLRSIRQLLYEQGYTIKGVQRLLRETGSRALVAAHAEASIGNAPLAHAPFTLTAPSFAPPPLTLQSVSVRGSDAERFGLAEEALALVEECSRILRAALERPIRTSAPALFEEEAAERPLEADEVGGQAERSGQTI